LFRGFFVSIVCVFALPVGVDPALIAVSDLLLLTGAAVVAVVVVAILQISGVTH